MSADKTSQNKTEQRDEKIVVRVTKTERKIAQSAADDEHLKLQDYASFKLFQYILNLM